MIVECKALLIQMGIHLDPNRECQQVEAIIDILYSQNHIQERQEEEMNEKSEIEDDQGTKTTKENKVPRENRNDTKKQGKESIGKEKQSGRKTTMSKRSEKTRDTVHPSDKDSSY